MRKAWALAAVAVAVLAGCTGQQTTTTTTTTTGPPPLPEGTYVHGAPLPASDVPRLAASVFDVGAKAFEPTLGVDAGGAIFFATADGEGGLLVGFEPDVYRSVDGGATWEAVGPRLPNGQAIPPETNDPFLYVDPTSGRVFQFPMAPIAVCSVLSWSDDKGDSWTSNPRGCGNPPPWDHQSMVAAPPAGLPTFGYPNVLHQCVNQVAAAVCSRSLDGGLTWTSGTQAYTAESFAVDIFNCSGSSVHGHPQAGPDGTVYLPTSLCGTQAGLAISRDDGTTWEFVQVSDVDPANADPAMAVDNAGTVHYTFIDDNGTLLLSHSTDGGRTWTDEVRAAPPGMTANIPTIAAAAGKVVLAYPGTFDIEGGFLEGEQSKAAWHPYLAVVLGAGANATFVTVRAGPEDDPIVRGPCGPGRCPGMVDFIDVVVGPDGRAYAAFVDVCVEECVTEGTGARDNNGGNGLLARLDDAILGRPWQYPAGNATALR